VVRVRVDRVSKRFTLRRHRPDSVGQLLLRMLPGRRAPEPEPFWALRDVSFQVEEGRSLGVIGPNGAGKSTLLKILTRTMAPTSGTVEIHGRVSALIELGAGFHPDFTGRENILLNASILGIPRREILRKMDDIIEFSGIAPFIDTPVKYYSSGMQARLGFSVAIHVEPDILIVDEVLAVGDQAFAAQCMERIRAMQRQGVSILLVSHDLSAVQRLTHEALWLDRGIPRAIGKPDEIVALYLGDSPQAPVSSLPLQLVDARISSPLRLGDALSVHVVLANSSRDTLHLDALIRIDAPGCHGLATLALTHNDRPLTVPPGRHTLTLRALPISLPPGTYGATLGLHLRHASDPITYTQPLQVHAFPCELHDTPGVWTEAM
jgi:ABC-type polysaccharide/polyol phosphate transport system ATPase subunit